MDLGGERAKHHRETAMHGRKLRAKLTDWSAAGLITAEQAAAIGEYEDRPQGRNWGMLIFAGFGAVILGLGVILLFAYNWQAMHKFAKLGLIFCALLLAHGAGLWLRRKNCPHAAAEAAHLLGTTLFGAGIFLVAQIYHISAHYPNAFLVWALGATLMTWALPSVSQGLLAAALLCLWVCAESASYDTGMAIAPLMIAAGVGIPALRLRSLVLLTASVLACAVSTMVGLAIPTKTYIPTLLALATLCFLLARLFGQGMAFPQAATVFRRVGLGLYLPLLFLLSFHEAGPSLLLGEQESVNLGHGVALLVCVLALWEVGRGLRRGEAGRADFHLHLLIPCLLLAACIPLALGNDESIALLLLSLFLSGLANLLFLSHTVLALWDGCREGRAILVLWGSLMLMAWVFARFTDLFESLLTRGCAFLLLGIALFFIASRYQRQGRGLPTEGERP